MKRIWLGCAWSAMRADRGRGTHTQSCFAWWLPRSEPSPETVPAHRRHHGTLTEPLLFLKRNVIEPPPPPIGGGTTPCGSYYPQLGVAPLKPPNLGNKAVLHRWLTRNRGSAKPRGARQGQLGGREGLRRRRRPGLCRGWAAPHEKPSSLDDSGQLSSNRVSKEVACRLKVCS